MNIILRANFVVVVYKINKKSLIVCGGMDIGNIVDMVSLWTTFYFWGV